MLQETLIRLVTGGTWLLSHKHLDSGESVGEDTVEVATSLWASERKLFLCNSMDITKTGLRLGAL